MKVRSKRAKTSNQPLLKNKVKQNKNSPRSSLMTSVLWRGGYPRTSPHTTGRPRRAATDRTAQSGHGTLERQMNQVRWCPRGLKMMGANLSEGSLKGEAVD